MHRKTILQAKEDLLQKKYSAVELTKAIYQRIESVEPKVQAYVHLTQDIALNQAQEADQKLAAGQDAPLLGIPIALKDHQKCSTSSSLHTMPRWLVDLKKQER